jgi:hypothetical protein
MGTDQRSVMNVFEMNWCFLWIDYALLVVEYWSSIVQYALKIKERIEYYEKIIENFSWRDLLTCSKKSQ